MEDEDRKIGEERRETREGTSKRSRSKKEKNGRSNYKQLKLLGRGSYGSAWLVRANNGDGLYVLKTIKLANLSREVKINAVLEARILEDLCHVNIVRFREVYRTEDAELCIVMEYAEGGDLSAVIKRKEGTELKLEESQIVRWVGQIASALAYIHANKIIHRDVKPQNIFLTGEGNVKLGDFGISKVLNFTADHARTFIGTPYYMSPEVLKSEEYRQETDIWALGVLTYELCTGRLPFTGFSLGALSLAIAAGKYTPIPSYYSAKLQKLVQMMLEVERSKRVSAEQICAILGVSNLKTYKPLQTEETESNRDKSLNQSNRSLLREQNLQRAKSAKEPSAFQNVNISPKSRQSHKLDDWQRLLSHQKQTKLTVLSSSPNLRLATAAIDSGNKNNNSNDDSVYVFGQKMLSPLSKNKNGFQITDQVSLPEEKKINRVEMCTDKQQTEPVEQESGAGKQRQKMIISNSPKSDVSLYRQRVDSSYRDIDAHTKNQNITHDDNNNLCCNASSEYDEEELDEEELRRTAAFALRLAQVQQRGKKEAVPTREKQKTRTPYARCRKTSLPRKKSLSPCTGNLQLIGIKKPLIPRRQES